MSVRGHFTAVFFQQNNSLWFFPRLMAYSVSDSYHPSWSGMGAISWSGLRSNQWMVISVSSRNVTAVDHRVCNCVLFILMTFYVSQGNMYLWLYFSLFVFPFKTMKKPFPWDSDDGTFAKMKELPVDTANFSRNSNSITAKCQQLVFMVPNLAQNSHGHSLLLCSHSESLLDCTLPLYSSLLRGTVYWQGPRSAGFRTCSGSCFPVLLFGGWQCYLSLDCPLRTLHWKTNSAWQRGKTSMLDMCSNMDWRPLYLVQ